MPMYRIPPVDGVTRRSFQVGRAGYGMPVGETARWPAAELQPWSNVTDAGWATDVADWNDDCRPRVTATRSATARMSVPTAASSWRRSGAFEIVRGVVADIGVVSSDVGPAPFGPLQPASFRCLHPRFGGPSCHRAAIHCSSREVPQTRPGH